MEGLQCLQCGAPLDQDFGIVACVKCGAVMMVDLDGKLQLAEDSPIPEEPAETGFALSDPTPAPEVSNESDVFFADQSTNHEAPVESIDAQLSAEPMAGMESYLPESEPTAEPLVDSDATVFHVTDESAEAPAENAEAPSAEKEYTGEDSSWFEQNLEPEGTPSAAPSEASAESAAADLAASGNFSDVEDFGNQESTEEGALQFELTLKGIDRGEVRAEVFKILADPRLYLSMRDLQAQIKNGILVISGLNAARTSLLVTRLQHLDLQIEWRQKIYEV